LSEGYVHGFNNIIEAVQRESISHCTLIPSFWSDLLSNHSHGDVDLSSLAAILLGGEPLAESLLNKIKTRVPACGLYAFYGQTEAPYTCIGRLDDNSQPLGMSGRARATCAAKVIDSQGQRVLNQAGELAVVGPHRMVEYFQLPEKTAEALRDGWFFSGDLATQDEQGFIHVLGRAEDAIVKQGCFIQPMEVENKALAIEGVAEAGAVGVPAGSDQQKIVLAVSLTPGCTLSEYDLNKKLQTVLPVELQPDRVVIAEQLVHGEDASGGKGKLLRRSIRDQYGALVK
jgi:acyl-coenzyme A synthetase/AMP-(fatty) acid ligase